MALRENEFDTPGLEGGTMDSLVGYLPQVASRRRQSPNPNGQTGRSPDFLGVGSTQVWMVGCILIGLLGADFPLLKREKPQTKGIAVTEPDLVTSLEGEMFEPQGGSGRQRSIHPEPFSGPGVTGIFLFTNSIREVGTHSGSGEGGQFLLVAAPQGPSGDFQVLSTGSDLCPQSPLRGRIRGDPLREERPPLQVQAHLVSLCLSLLLHRSYKLKASSPTSKKVMTRFKSIFALSRCSGIGLAIYLRHACDNNNGP